MLVQVEITNACNLSCSYCPRTANPQKTRSMYSTEILHVLREVHEIKVMRNARIALCGHGEPLFCKGLFDILDKPLLKKLPHLDLVTNGMLLTRDITKKLVDANVFDTIQVSLQTVDPCVYSQLQVHSDFTIVLKNLKYLIEYTKDKPTNVKVQHLRTLLNKEETIDEFSEKLGIPFDDHFILHPHNVGPVGMRAPKKAYGYIIPKLDVEKPLYGHKRACDGTYAKSVIINVFGDLLGCCWDNSRKQSYGNIFFRSLRSLRESNQLKEMRAELKAHDFNRLPLCKVCMEKPI